MFTRIIARSATTLFYTPVSTPNIESGDKLESPQTHDSVLDVQASEQPDASPLPRASDLTQPSTSNASSQTAVEDNTMSIVKMPEPSIQRQDEVAPGYTQGAHPDVMIDKKHHPTSTDGASSAGSPTSGELVPTTHGTFAGGSATAAELPDQPALHDRAATAETMMSNEEKAKLEKMEAKDAKRLSKMIKSEAKTEEKLLKTSMKELESIHKTQKSAASDEASAIKAHAKAVKLEQKLNKAYLKAKGKLEMAQADLHAKTEGLESVRAHAESSSALLAQKTKEVEQLRAQKATDDRERQAKLHALANPGLASA